MKASDVIARTRDLLLDTVEPYRWTDAELLRWLSDAQRALVVRVPEAHTTASTVKVLAGKYRQALPANAYRLLDVPRNLGVDGTTPGSVIRLIGRSVIDALVPAWMSATGPVIEHYMYDYKQPGVFLVYPTPATDMYVECVHSTAPAEVTALASDLPLSDMYQSPLVNYTAFRAFAKDIDSPVSAERAAAYNALFKGDLDDNTASTSARVPASQAGSAVA